VLITPPRAGLFLQWSPGATIPGRSFYLPSPCGSVCKTFAFPIFSVHGKFPPRRRPSSFLSVPKPYYTVSPSPSFLRQVQSRFVFRLLCPHSFSPILLLVLLWVLPLPCKPPLPLTKLCFFFKNGWEALYLPNHFLRCSQN